MKYKMIVTAQLFFYLILFYGDVSVAKPLAPEDLEGLLPPTPRDTNETIAAVVQDPVVQDAVHQAASNGSLNGLVVKKKVYIMPASDPNTILTKREHLLVVPTENLEDVRKNITEAKQAEAESSSPDDLSLFESDVDGYTSEISASPDFQETESGPPSNNQPPSSSLEITERSMPVADRRKTEFLKDTISRDAPSPEVEPTKMTVPIVAVIDPSSVDKGKVNAPIVAILPSTLNNGALKSQVQLLKDNSDRIQSKVQSYVEQTSLTVDPGNWLPSASSEAPSPSTQGTEPVSFLPEQAAPNFPAEEMLLAPVVVPRWGIVGPIFPDDGVDYLKATGDLDVAEDLIFRPLFRYRQESQERSRYREDSSNRRYGYRPNRDYDYYPRRGYYRSRYEDY
ncbi:uncharacterized protein LOC143374786 isoform X1 [Andrena cerasifolii]|uniref:uncharacterized protein LOC143374786 isoform X1 n=1 Tax=Andrena cerasifolii TaxID=2819439 RepID=UPI0040376AF1